MSTILPSPLRKESEEQINGGNTWEQNIYNPEGMLIYSGKCISRRINEKENRSIPVSYRFD